VPAGGAPLVIAGPTPGVTETVADGALAPTELTACTEHVYVVPLVSGPTLIGLVAFGVVTAPGLHVATKLVIAEPPLDAGGVKEIVAKPFPGVAVPMVGAPGTVGAIVIEKLCVTVPPLFAAVTTPVNVPVAFGVPVSAPVVPFNVRPVGNAPEVRLNVGAGEPFAV